MSEQEKKQTDNTMAIYMTLGMALGWSMHVIWDVGLHLMGPGHHVAPEWYAVACLSFGLVVAGYIIYLSKLD